MGAVGEQPPGQVLRAYTRRGREGAREGSRFHALRARRVADSRGGGLDGDGMTRDGRSARMRRLFALPRRRDSMQRDIEDEIRFHLDSRAAELVEAGLPGDAAREQAVAEYGDLAASSAELARVDGGRIERMRWTDRLEAIRTDVAYAVRVLRKQPGFTAAVIIVLALGIGANATMFGVIDRLLLRAPAQIGAPERVVNASFVRSSGRDSSTQDVLSYPIFMDLRSVHGAFENVAAYTPVSLAVGNGSGAQSVPGMRVSANFFSTP